MATKKVDTASPFAVAEAERAKLVASLATQPIIIEASKILWNRSNDWGKKYNIGKTAIAPSAKAIEIGKQMDDFYAQNSGYAVPISKAFSILLGEEIPLKITGVDKVKFETGTVVKLIKNLPGTAKFNYPVNTPLFVLSGASALAVPTEAGLPQNHMDNSAGNIQIPSEVEIGVGLAELYLRDASIFQSFVDSYGK
jgi:hypothetical protein